MKILIKIFKLISNWLMYQNLDCKDKFQTYAAKMASQFDSSNCKFLEYALPAFGGHVSLFIFY